MHAIKYIDPKKSDWQGNFSDVVTALRQARPAPALDGALQKAGGASSIPLTAMLAKAPGGKAPKAYLNYVMYDDNFQPIMDPAQTNYVQVTENAKESGRNGDHERLYAEVEVQQAGYLYIYLSNDNYELQGEQVDVFFDDFQIQQVHSKVVQSDDYYPFGLTFNSYSRENTTPQDFKYNGKEEQNELNLGWLDYGARMFDPVIARWMAVDPAAELMKQYSPYVYSFDNPIRFVDRDGMIPEQVTTDPPDLKAITSGKQIDMTSAPARGVNAAGHPRNGPWFWKQMLEKYPQMFSEANKNRILDPSGSKAPLIDDNWIDFNPSHAAYKGDKLIHHHVDQGHMATGIPDQVHRKHFSDLHANKGGRAKGGGAMGKVGIGLGLLSLVYDIFSDDPHALGMQFSAGNKLNTVYYDMGTDQYFEVTERGKETDGNGVEWEYSVYNTYESYQYNKDTKKNEGVNKTGTYKAVRVKSLDEAYQYLYEGS